MRMIWFVFDHTAIFLLLSLCLLIYLSIYLLGWGRPHYFSLFIYLFIGFSLDHTAIFHNIFIYLFAYLFDLF